PGLRLTWIRTFIGAGLALELWSRRSLWRLRRRRTRGRAPAACEPCGARAWSADDRRRPASLRPAAARGPPGGLARSSLVGVARRTGAARARSGDRLVRPAREGAGAGGRRGCAGAAVAELVLCGSRLAAPRRARRTRCRGDLRYGPDHASGGGIRGDDYARGGQGLPRGGPRPGPPRMAGRTPGGPRPRGQSGADSRLRRDRASDRSRTRSARRRGPRGLAQPAARVAAPDRHV